MDSHDQDEDDSKVNPTTHVDPKYSFTPLQHLQYLRINVAWDLTNSVLRAMHIDTLSELRALVLGTQSTCGTCEKHASQQDTTSDDTKPQQEQAEQKHGTNNNKNKKTSKKQEEEAQIPSWITEAHRHTTEMKLDG